VIHRRSVALGVRPGRGAGRAAGALGLRPGRGAGRAAGALGLQLELDPGYLLG
jgi:hypothetical protein